VYSAHETKAPSWKRFDETLLFAGVADRASDGVQPGRQRRVRYNPTIPDRVYEIVLADDAIPAADQILEQIENLWRRRHNIGPAPQLAPVGVQRTVLEEIAHGTIPRLAPYPPRAGQQLSGENKPSVREM
jgi:hypothetical protein